MTRNAYVSTATEERLRAYIHDEFAPGAQLPGERELADKLDSSRSTLREIVTRLCHSGELVRKWGIGTFVSPVTKPFALDLSSTEPLRVSAERQGFEAEFTFCRIDKVPVPKHLQSVWGLPSGVLVWRIHRVLSLNGFAAVTLIDHAPLTMGGFPVPMDRLGKDNQFDVVPFLFETTGLLITHFDAHISVATAPGEIAELLQVEPSSSLLTTNLVSRDLSASAITHCELWYSPRWVDLTVSSSRESTSASPSHFTH